MVHFLKSTLEFCPSRDLLKSLPYWRVRSKETLITLPLPKTQRNGVDDFLGFPLIGIPNASLPRVKHLKLLEAIFCKPNQHCGISSHPIRVIYSSSYQPTVITGFFPQPTNQQTNQQTNQPTNQPQSLVLLVPFTFRKKKNPPHLPPHFSEVLWFPPLRPPYWGSGCISSALILKVTSKTASNHHPPKNPRKFLYGTQSHGGLLQMMFLVNWMIFRFQPLRLQGCIDYCSCHFVHPNGPMV